MKTILLTVLSLVSTSAFAQSSISVIIDGKTYSCSAGGSAPDCREKVELTKSKYNACITAYSVSYCYGSAVKPALDKACADSVQFCYTTCTKAYSSSYCYGECY